MCYLQWGQLTTIVDSRALWKGFTATHGLAVWDPTPLYDKASGETFLFFGETFCRILRRVNLIGESHWKSQVAPGAPRAITGISG